MNRTEQNFIRDTESPLLTKSNEDAIKTENIIPENIKEVHRRKREQNSFLGSTETFRLSNHKENSQYP